MSKADYAKCSNFFVIAFLIIFIHFCTSAPVNVTENVYTQLVAELNRKKCSVPSQVQLPFDTTEVNNFEYLSSNLEICQKTESTKRNKEAVVLCKEIFANIGNISCPTKTALPDTIRVGLSENVCQDIGALKDSVPDDDKSLLKILTDSFVCDIMCDSEFEKACRVLLWSFEVRKQIASVASAQELKQPSAPGDGADMNEDSFKQENTVEGTSLPEISVNPEDEKKNADGAKDATKVVGHDEMLEVPEPSEIEENPDQKLDTSFNPSAKDRQEKPASNDKETVIANQAVQKTKSQDSTAAYQSTNSTQTQSSIIPQKPGTQASNSDTEVKLAEETTKSESKDQNLNESLQSDVTKNGEVNAGGELSRGSNTDVVANEQTQEVDANTLADGAVQDERGTKVLVNKHLQDNSNIPVSQDIPVDDEYNIRGNEIPEETPEKGDQNSNLPKNNDLPHDSANDKSPNEAAADLHKDDQNPSNFVNTIDQNKLQSTAINDDSLTKKTNSPASNSQTTKDTTRQQTAQETTQDKTSVAGDKTKAPPTHSVSRKVEETEDHAKTDAITRVLVTDGRTTNPSTDQKKPKVAQKTEEFDNTIPDPKETSIIIPDEQPPGKDQKLKPTVVIPDGKIVVPSSLTETSTKTTVALEKMEGGSDLRQPADEEADHYGDLENTDGEEYTGPEYDGGFGENPKNKASNPDIPGPITAAKEILTSQNEEQMEFPSRNGLGPDSSDIRMISFPEQEDSHFFFYFLSIVLILMAGYLIFHNKQKIIALIVEGRHERNRRSHRIGYKKLETK